MVPCEGTFESWKVSYAHFASSCWVHLGCFSAIKQTLYLCSMESISFYNTANYYFLAFFLFFWSGYLVVTLLLYCAIKYWRNRCKGGRLAEVEGYI